LDIRHAELQIVVRKSKAGYRLRAANSFVCLLYSCQASKRGSRVLFLSFREITMNTARTATAFMLMFNIIAEKEKPKRKCVSGLRNFIVGECNMEIDLCEM
jgi:hypothetical protein